MIDVKKLVQNPDLYKNELAKRFMKPETVDNIVDLYQQNKQEQQILEELRKQKNEFNKKVIELSGEEKQTAILSMKTVSEKIKSHEELTKTIQEQLQDLLYKIPNLTWGDIPVGRDDSANVVIKDFGVKPSFNFEVKNYFDLPVFKRDYLSQKGVDAFGSRGYYIRGELMKLQRSLFNYVIDQLIAKNFELVYPPIMVNEESLYGTGFFPTGRDDMYQVQAGDKEYFLVGTSEAPLMFLESGNTLDLDEPKLLTASTTCFRKEAGSYGKDTQGGIRVHQFEKVETVCLCKPEDSEKMFNKLTQTFTDHMLLLGLHIHHLEVCSGDISIKNHRQIDIEAWFPAQNQYRELSSSSNCTDYQTRNLNIKYKKLNGDVELAHSLNCTGVVNRVLFAIMEQFQQEDGSVLVPAVLQPYFGKEVLK